MRKFLLLTIMLIAGGLAFAQRTITGRVTDANGNPLKDVSVTVKNTNVGTVTGSDGSFSLNVPASGTALVFSFTGMQSRELAIGTQSVFNVSLSQGDSTLTEVVVTSFGIRRDKRTLGYSTPVISGEDLTQAKATNITNALGSKVAGVQVSGTGGAFTGSSVIIRGNTSVTGFSQPLYVIDGMPIDNSGGGIQSFAGGAGNNRTNTTGAQFGAGGTGDLQYGPAMSNRAIDINPDDIESITVLKGGAATSLYGSRGAGGVILITTKKGNRRAKSSVELSSSFNVVSVNRLPELQNQYAQGSGGVYKNNVSTSWGPEIKGQPVTNWYGQTENLAAYPNNVKDIFQNGYTLQNNVSFSGGSEKTAFRFSYGNTGETYVLRNNKLNRNTFAVNINSAVTPKLNVTSFVNFTNTNSKRTQSGNQLSNPLFRAYFIPRSFDLTNTPYYDAQGKQLFWGGEDHPYWNMENVKYNDEVNRVIANLGLRYSFTNWLNAEARVAIDFFNFEANGFDEIGIRGGGNTGSGGLGGVIEMRNNSRDVGGTFTLNAQQKFGDFGLTATVGNEVGSNRVSNSTVRGVELTVAGFNQMSNAKTYTPLYGFAARRIVGLFADAVLDYKNWLSLNVKARNDFSSTLHPDNNSIFYPAAALSVNPTEIFPELKSDFVNMIKLRGSWGKVGSSPAPYNTSNYLALANPSDGFGPQINFPFNGQIGFTTATAAGSPGLKPEFTTEWEIGTDIALWDRRITLEANYYQRKLTEGLFSVPVSGASGITQVFQNAGEMSTKGTEISLGLVPVRTSSGFTWFINANYTRSRTMVDKLAPGVANIFLGGFTTPNVRLVAGEEYGQIYGTAYQRDAQGRLILQTTGPNAGLPLPTAGVVNIGNPNPKFRMGINNSIAFKGFDFSFLIDIKQGGDLYSRNVADLRRNGAAKETAEFARYDKDGNLLKPYMFEGVDASGNPVNIPVSAEQYWGNSGKYVAAEGYIVNTSWVRLREANLTYRFPQTIINKTPFGNIELGVFGRNLFMKTKTPHIDPEQNILGVSGTTGLEYNALPSTRTLGLNLRLTL